MAPKKGRNGTGRKNTLRAKSVSISKAAHRRRRNESAHASPPPAKSPRISGNNASSETVAQNSSHVTPNVDEIRAHVPLIAHTPLPLEYNSPAGSGNSIIPEVIDPKISLASVGGLSEQVAYIRKNILYPMEHKADFEAFGIEPVKGVIFHGPPGTGKTLLAKALASELSKNSTKVNFFMRKGSDCYSKWVGDSEKTLRTLFRTAQAMKPSIIFLDELDGLCPARTDSGEGSQFYNSVVTCLLGLIDEIKRGEVFLIGATNRLEALDPAIKRPGRFDKALPFFPPNETGRKQILEIALSKWKSKPSKTLMTELAGRTIGFTGADLEQLCKEAFDCALDRQIPEIGHPDQVKRGKSEVKLLEVLEEDWNKALTKMGKSNSNVFGSSIFTGSAVDPNIRVLINGIANEISVELKQFIGSTNSISGTGIKSFLVWGDSVPTVDVVDTFIFSSVVNTFDAEKTPGFIISEETLSTTPLLTILNQVQNCRTGCFLFVPRIDQLWTTLKTTGLQDIFRKRIEMTRGTGIVLVASSVSGVSSFPEELGSIFDGMNRTYKVRKPNATERKEFFELIFNPNSKFLAGLNSSSKNSKCYSGNLEKLSARAQKLTEKDEIKNILNLNGELALVFGKQLSGQDLLDELKDVVDQYEDNKLSH